MRKIVLTALCAVALAANAQFGRPQIQHISFKDAYKDYFMVGVAVNQRNISQPDQIALVKQEYNSITAENDMKPV